MEKSCPFISVIIPTYERAGQLSVCLGALAAQDYPRDRFEALVVDDGSATSPESTVNAYRHQLKVQFLTQRHAGPAAARNYGAAHAQGEILAFTDDDCMPASDWLSSLASGFGTCSDCVLGGLTINVLTENVYSTASQLIVDYLYFQWNHDPRQATFFTSNNVALSLRCFRAVGGFDTGWTCAAGEDRDLCDRLVSAGYGLRYLPGAMVRHAHSLTLSKFLRQQFNYGCGAYRLYRVRARRVVKGVRFQPMGFYLRLLAFPFVRTGGGEAVGLAGLLMMALAANVAGFFWERVAGTSVDGDMKPEMLL